MASPVAKNPNMFFVSGPGSGPGTLVGEMSPFRGNEMNAHTRPPAFPAILAVCLFFIFASPTGAQSAEQLQAAGQAFQQGQRAQVRGDVARSWCTSSSRARLGVDSPSTAGWRRSARAAPSCTSSLAATS
jgi:hypothetical protein